MAVGKSTPPPEPRRIEGRAINVYADAPSFILFRPPIRGSVS